MESSADSPPTFEATRLSALRSYRVLDTDAEPSFDDITALASELCGTPIALISLVDAQRQWFKSRVGLDAVETPRDWAFCDHAIRHPDEVMTVVDASIDPRFNNNPLVTGSPNVRFYAGASLVSPEGQALGTLCVIDTQARELNPAQAKALATLARQVMSQLELRRQRYVLAATVAQRNDDLAALQSLQAALVEREQRLARIAAQLPGVVYQYHLRPDGSSCFSYASEGIRDIYGVTPEEVLHDATPVFQRLHPEDYERVAHSIGVSADKLELWDCEYRVVVPGRSVLWVQGRSMPERLPDGGTLWHGFITDITQRKAAEQLLRESEQQLRLALSGGDLGLWDWNATGANLVVNARWLSMLGLDPEGPMPTIDQWHSMVHSDDVPLIDRALETVNLDPARREFEVEVRARRADGQEVWILHKGAVVERAPDGSPLRVVGTHMDITRRKLAEAQLRRSEEDLSITLHSIGDAVVAIDAVGCVTRMNPTAERLTGWRLPEAFGRPLAEVFRIVHARTRKPAIDPVEQVLRTGGIVALANHTTLLSRDGSEHHIADSAAPIRDASGAIVGVVLVFSDVSEVYRVRQALARTAQLLERTSAMAHVGGWELDLPSQQLEWTQETCRIHEVDSQRAPSLDEALAFYETDARDTIQAALRAAVDDGVPFDLELPLQTAKGNGIWVRVQGSAVRDGERTIKLQGALHDITVRRRAESNLQQNEQRLQALLDNISSGVIVHGPDTHIIDANPAACRVTGLTLDQMRGKVAIDPCWCFLEEDGSVMPLDRFPAPQVLARGSAVNKLVLGVRRPDLPRPVWVQVDAYPFRDDEGQISQIVVTFADITELKLAEDGTRRLNRSLRVLSSCSASQVNAEDESSYLGQVCEAVAAAGGFLLACVVFANRDPGKSARFAARAGPAADYLQTIQLSWDEGLPTGRGPFGVAVRTGRTQVNQDWLASDAMAPWREAALRHGFESSIALPLTVSNEVIGTLSLYAAEHGAFNPEEVQPLEELARNISVAIETFRTRQQRDLAEGASRAKSEFLANMSHEIRTPLNAIVGLNYLLRRDGVTPEQAARLDKIDGASKHLLSLINDILDLSKIEARQVQLEASNFHLSAVLDAVASIITESARAKGLTIETDANAVPLWLRGDPTRLRQALLNYAGNAVKFTESGSIALRAKLLENRGDELLVRFSVEDTGTGIQTEDIPRLFQAFEQADTSITRKYGGTGLGLAITKRLTELMGGECGVESRLGIGSTFWFTAHLQRGHGILPLADTRPVATAEAQLRLRHRGSRILVAEDNEVNQEVLLAMLYGVGLNADIAANGQDAVALAMAGAYDMVLMDMQMPVMGGLEATRAIRALPDWAERPILALTANAFDEDREACKASGMNDFIVKPVDVNSLYTTILKWLDSAGGQAGEARDEAKPLVDNDDGMRVGLGS